MQELKLNLAPDILRPESAADSWTKISSSCYEYNQTVCRTKGSASHLVTLDGICMINVSEFRFLSFFLSFRIEIRAFGIMCIVTAGGRDGGSCGPDVAMGRYRGRATDWGQANDNNTASATCFSSLSFPLI